MSITGPAVGVTVSGGGASRVFQVDGGVTATFSDLTITKGSTTTNGGGLYNQGGTVSLTNCTVSSSVNTVGSTNGGGLCNNGGSLTLTNCTIAGNSAPSGGGLGNLAGTTTLTDCTISGNYGTDGGGLARFGGTLSLTNCTVVGNSSTGGGGVSTLNGGTLTLTNCTVTGNTAAAAGAIGGVSLYGGTATLTNTIVTGNSNGDISGSFNGTNNLIGAPLTLAPLGDYGGPTATEALLPGSPAIGAGASGAGIPTTDQRGQPRTGHVDIGAFQSQGFTLTLVAGSTPQSAAAGSAFAHPLAVAVTAVNSVEPVDGGIISFTAPAAGASAVLSAATAVIASGQASVTATAGTVAGSYTVTASAAGVSTAASFALTNTPAAAASVAVVSGSGQTATVATGFAAPLVAVVKDAYGNPVPGVSVTFAAPASGASATLTGSPAVTGADGQASVTATAGTIAGFYTVTASVAGVTTAASFELFNFPGAAASVAVVSGSGQKAAIATGFAAPLVAVVKDAYGNPVPGVSVTFAAPASGASATLTGSPAVTGADGQASVTATANTTLGSYTVTASVDGVTTAVQLRADQYGRRRGVGGGGLRVGPDGDGRHRVRCAAGGGGQGCLRQPGARRQRHLRRAGVGRLRHPDRLAGRHRRRRPGQRHRHRRHDRRLLHRDGLGGRRHHRGQLRADQRAWRRGVGGGGLRVGPDGDGRHRVRCAAGGGGQGCLRQPGARRQRHLRSTGVRGLRHGGRLARQDRRRRSGERQRHAQGRSPAPTP